MKFLVADNDPELIELVNSALALDGFTVLAAKDGETAAELLDRETPDVILLNRALSKRSAEQVLQDLRLRTSIPVIMLTASDDEEHVVSALDMGADDCWVKPLRPREMRARTLALVRRSQLSWAKSAGARVLELGAIRLDARIRRVTVNGAPVHLSRTEFALLEFLMTHHDLAIGLPQLVTSVWGYDGTDNESVVKVAVSRLRRKIEQDPSSPRLIVNIPGVGYMFASPVPA